MSDLITTTADAYEGMAINLAKHPEQLTALKRRLADNRLATPLFDAVSFTRDIEKAYRMMHERHREGLAPDDIFVSS